MRDEEFYPNSRPFPFIEEAAYSVMKIALIAPTHLPARRANTIQVMKMAQAFTALGHEIRVWVPGLPQQPPTPDELARHYGLQRRFDVDWLPRRARLRSYDYALAAVRRSRAWRADLIYTRLPQAAALAAFLEFPVIYEIHDFPQGTLAPWLLTRFLHGRGARGLVVITAALHDALARNFPALTRHPVILAPDGVDLARYQNLPAPSEARKTLDFQDSAFTVGYTGHLYPGRGAELILEIAARLPKISFLLVGGEPADVARVRTQARDRRLENVTLTGFIPNAELPRYQAACDVLLMPYQRRVAASSGGDIAAYLSPMKLFEYLACGRAILVSDLPVLREVLNPANAVLLPPDDPAAWVSVLRELQADDEKRLSLAEQARADVRQYSWEARARRILTAMTPAQN